MKKQIYSKNCIGCGKFVLKKQWVKLTDFKNENEGALCYECIGNIEQPSRD